MLFLAIAVLSQILHFHNYIKAESFNTATQNPNGVSKPARSRYILEYQKVDT